MGGDDAWGSVGMGIFYTSVVQELAECRTGARLAEPVYLRVFEAFSLLTELFVRWSETATSGNFEVREVADRARTAEQATYNWTFVDDIST